MIKEKQRITVEEGDAPEFIDLLNTIIGETTARYAVKEGVYVKIKNWFDHKWLNYSGKTVVPFETGGLKNVEDAALKNVWSDKISIPPFNPNRVIYSKFFQMQNTGNPKIRKAIHQYRFSNHNIHNRISEYTSDGLVIWFSSNTSINHRGSIMLYRVQNDAVYWVNYMSTIWF